MMSLAVPHDVSASVQLRTEEGSGSDRAKTLTNTLGRWFLPRVPHSLHVDRSTGGNSSRKSMIAIRENRIQ